MNKSVLITGINGFLGRHLLNALTAKDYRVAGLCRTDTSLIPENPGVKLYTNAEALFRQEPGFEYIFHLASFIPYGKFHEPHAEFYTTNIKLTGLIDEHYASSKFVFASSVAVYGVPLQLPLQVNSPFNRPDYYGLSKIAGEAIVKNHANHAIIRFSSIIGKGMKPVTLIPKMIEQVKQTKAIQVWGTGERMQNYIDVRDAARLCMQCADYSENIITLGVAEKSYTNNQAAQLIALNTGAIIEYTGEDASPSFTYDPSPEYKTLHFKPAITFERTIAEMKV
ncbi:NAD-dependent epimerase/dehydratase family protein [Agriterribacter humi]|uniref:NAD-dependent epimerase/dehydratase family protein n=1 Tax=Agriterribacter humi TaxID=1104781 RepID=UPI0012655FA0|nr:NAD(P)-dependent oxidoreductase [Agriterribacter humi]